MSEYQIICMKKSQLKLTAIPYRALYIEFIDLWWELAEKTFCNSVDMEVNNLEIITSRENIKKHETNISSHSCQLSHNGEENKTGQVLAASPSTFSRRTGIAASYNGRLSLKGLLLSCQKKSNSSENTQINSELSQEGVSMALKRSSSVPNRVAYPLHDAIINADVKELGKLFKKKRRIDIDLKDQEGFSALHRAAQLGLTEAVELLVSHGANVNLKDKGNLTPLYYAVQSGNFECASYLIEHGADDSDIKDGFMDSKMPEFKSGKLSRTRMSVHN